MRVGCFFFNADNGRRGRVDELGADVDQAVFVEDCCPLPCVRGAGWEIFDVQAERVAFPNVWCGDCVPYDRAPSFWWCGFWCPPAPCTRCGCWPGYPHGGLFDGVADDGDHAGVDLEGVGDCLVVEACLD